MKRAYGLIALSGVSGAAVMAAEMGLIRAMAPYFGATTYVWMMIIGAVLGALSIGYWAGGLMADRWPRSGPLCATVAAGAGLLILAAFLVKPLSLFLLPAEGAPIQVIGPALFRGALATSLVLVAPPIALLGVVGPWVTRLLTVDGVQVGRAAGIVLAVSTFGSLLGTCLPPLVLIPAMGSRLTVVSAAVVLLIVVALVAGLSRGQKASAVGGAGLLLILAGVLQAAVPLRGGDDLVLERESPYQYVRVAQKPSADATTDTYRVLTLNEGGDDFHTKVIPEQFLTGAYYDWYVPLVGLVAPPGEPKALLRIAILGLAGGAHSRALHAFCDPHYTMQIDGVEIDPVVIDVAQRELQMTASGHPRLRVHAADARPWLRAVGGRFDLIILDAFTQQLYIPFYLATQEFFELVRDRLAPGGVLAFNVYPALPEGELTGAFSATLKSVFGTRVWWMRLPYTDGNVLVVARKAGGATAGIHGAALQQIADVNRGHPEHGALEQRVAQLRWGLKPFDVPGRILTDDHAPVEILTERDMGRLRAQVMEQAR